MKDFLGKTCTMVYYPARGNVMGILKQYCVAHWNGKYIHDQWIWNPIGLTGLAKTSSNSSL